MTITEPGIYPHISAHDYYCDPCAGPSLTQSLAKVIIERSPLHAKCAHPRLRDNGSDDEAEAYSAAKAIGTAAHYIMIRRGKELAIADFDSWRTKEAKAFRDEAEAAGKTPILMAHFERATKMVNAARFQLIEGGFYDAFAQDQGDGEVCIAWQEDGLWFRSLIDWLPHDRLVLIDLKTTGLSVAPHGLGRLMVDAGWDIQAAMHERGLDVLDPINAGRRKFRFVAQENEPPYALVVCELSEAVLTMGRKKLDHAIHIWRECMQTDKWPAYPPELQFPEYPQWREMQWLDREVAHEERRAQPTQRDAMNLLAG